MRGGDDPLDPLVESLLATGREVIEAMTATPLASSMPRAERPGGEGGGARARPRARSQAEEEEGDSGEEAGSHPVVEWLCPDSSSWHVVCLRGFQTSTGRISVSSKGRATPGLVQKRALRVVSPEEQLARRKKLSPMELVVGSTVEVPWQGGPMGLEGWWRSRSQRLPLLVGYATWSPPATTGGGRGSSILAL